MIKVGLTGGIGSGKSEVARQLVAYGAVVIDADGIAREVVDPGTPGLQAVVAEFGPEILTAGGELDRAALARRVFGDEEARHRLNGIVHPLVAQRTKELLAEQPADAVIVHDVPLLVENRMAPAYDLVVVVEAPEDVQIARLVESRGMAPADARARIKAQATREERRKVADVVLDNGGGLEALREQVRELWQRISMLRDERR